MKKYFYYISIIVIALMVTLVVFFKTYVSGEISKSCNEMKMIAADAKKINHIKSSVSPYYGSKELLDGIGRAKYLDKNFNPILFDKLNVDWNYVGLPEYLVQIYFDGAMYNEGDFERIRVHFGRNAISINLSGSSDGGYGAETVSQSHIIKVSDSVTVFCSK